MKPWMMGALGLLAIAGAGVAPLPARAQAKLDLEAVSCADLYVGPNDDKELRRGAYFVSMWGHGYVTAKNKLFAGMPKAGWDELQNRLDSPACARDSNEGSYYSRINSAAKALNGRDVGGDLLHTTCGATMAEAKAMPNPEAASKWLTGRIMWYYGFYAGRRRGDMTVDLSIAQPLADGIVARCKGKDDERLSQMVDDAATMHGGLR